MFVRKLASVSVCQKVVNIAKQNIKCSSTTNRDILQDINDEDLPKLLDIYKQNWPKCMEPYFVLDNYLNWKRRNPEMNIQITCPDGKWEDGTFVLLSKIGLDVMFVYSLDKSGDRLAKALEDSNRIEWKKGPMIYNIHENYADKIVSIAKNKGPILHEYPFFNWHIHQTEALKLNRSCPPNCYFEHLQPHHAAELSKTWTIQCEGTEEYLETLIKMNGGIALYSENNHEMLSSSINTDMGNIGVIQTPKKFRKMGYGIKVMIELTLERAKVSDAAGYTVQGNVAMNNLLASLGYKILHRGTFLKLGAQQEK